MNAFASGEGRAFERLSDKAGALPGDVRLFDRNPGPGWVAEDASVPFSKSRAPYLLLDAVGGFQTTVAPFTSQDILGLTRVGDRVYVWQGQRVAYTDDGGDTFTTITTNATTSVVFGGAVVFNGLLVLAGYAPGGGVCFIDVSSDGGATFVRRKADSNTTWNFVEVIDGALFIGGGPGLYRSTDGLNFVGVDSIGSAPPRSIVANGPYLHVGVSNGVVTLQRNNLAQVAYFSPGGPSWDGICVGPEGAVYATSASVVYRSVTGVDGYYQFAKPAQPANFPYIQSLAYIDGLFFIGWNRASGNLARCDTTRDFRTSSEVLTFHGSGQDGVKKVVRAGNRLLVGGNGFARGAPTALRGLLVDRKPPGRQSAKAYTRL